MSKSRYKKLLEHQSQDFRYFLEHPIEYEVFQEEYLYVKRVGIKSKDSFSLEGTLLFTPDVDAVSVLQLSSGGSKLFSRMLEADIKSPLIQHFSECEEIGKAYTDPETGLILWRRVPVLAINPASGKEENSALQSPKMLYSLAGGFDYFHRLRALDKDFLRGLLAGFRKGLCDPYRLDLCADLSYDIMGHVNEAITKGHYECFHRHPYGFGWLGGKRIEGAVGKYSKSFQWFGKEQLRLDTIYFGKPKRNNYVIIFYDKRTERKEREKARWPNKSRIEVRIFARDSESKRQMLDVLETYISDSSGWETRTEIFTRILYNNVKFTTSKRNRNQFINPIAPWWRSLIGTLIHPLIKQKRSKEGVLSLEKDLLGWVQFSEPRKVALPVLNDEGKLLNYPLRLEAGDLILKKAQKENGDAACIKKKIVKLSHFDRISEIALGCSTKEEFQQFRNFYRKYNINKYLSKEQINEIKVRFWGTKKKANKSS